MLDRAEGRRIASNERLAAFLHLSAYRLEPGYASARVRHALREPIAPPIDTGVLSGEIATPAAGPMRPFCGGLRDRPIRLRSAHPYGRLGQIVALTL